MQKDTNLWGGDALREGEIDDSSGILVIRDSDLLDLSLFKTSSLKPYLTFFPRRRRLCQFPYGMNQPRNSEDTILNSHTLSVTKTSLLQ